VIGSIVSTLWTVGIAARLLYNTLSVGLRAGLGGGAQWKLVDKIVYYLLIYRYSAPKIMVIKGFR
jgi:hypothetical protein